MASFNFNAYQHETRLHATLASIGFVVLIPIGILIPRYARTFTNKWFYGHAIFQTLVSGPVIVAGVAYGLKATQRTVATDATTNFGDTHTKLGLTLFVLYFAQVLLGVFSHFVKRPSSSIFLHRTPHQILHIMLGLAIFGLAFYQVHLGYTVEWVTFVGLPVPTNVNTAWMALVILFPILYVLGYALYPRQIKQEAEYRQRMEKQGFA
ncbi:hypothetical protein BU17DRAFT_75762 [Hysterangium stoloniferum]|nr:hypothetical protein BU17DRAFT_75762 [Hysterangium stoloniferum]